jgi:hypothetical protein
VNLWSECARSLTFENVVFQVLVVASGALVVCGGILSRSIFYFFICLFFIEKKAFFTSGISECIFLQLLFYIFNLK